MPGVEAFNYLDSAKFVPDYSNEDVLLLTLDFLYE